MRILLTISAEQDAPYENDYHYHLQSLFYRLMLEGGRNDIHGRENYKFFCFSNIFPYHERFIRDSRYNLIFSSPDVGLCSDVFKTIERRIGSKGESSMIRIGGLKFRLEEVTRPFRLDLGNSPSTNQTLRVRSATPIIIRILNWRYKDYGINSERLFEFWRETISLDAFVKQLRDGAEKKVEEFRRLYEEEFSYKSNGECHTTLSSPSIIPEILSYRYVRSVSKPITIKGETQQVIGSIWELEFLPQNEEESKNLEFSLDSGFGERNSLGFGYVNII